MTYATREANASLGEFGAPTSFLLPSWAVDEFGLVMARAKKYRPPKPSSITKNTMPSVARTRGYKYWFFWSLVTLFVAIFVALIHDVYFNQRKSNSLFEIVDLPGRGKGVVAARDIQVCLKTSLIKGLII